MKRKFIVFEGVDGAGKSEVSMKVAKKINAIHLESPIGIFRKIRKHVDNNLHSKGRFLFYLASNYYLSDYICKQKSDKAIICVRYFHSTMIGYISRQGLDLENFYQNLSITLDDLLKPDLTIFLYVNEETQKNRLSSRLSNSVMDYHCLNDDNYRNRLFNNYKHVANKENWILIDTSYLSIDEVVKISIEQIMKK